MFGRGSKLFEPNIFADSRSKWVVFVLYSQASPKIEWRFLSKIKSFNHESGCKTCFDFAYKFA